MGRTELMKSSMEENKFEVESGAMKRKIPGQDVAEVVAQAGSSPVAAARARGISVSVKEETNVPMEINVIGQNVDQATQEVEKFIDRAFLAGLVRVRIVHGSGMGILRQALPQLL